VRYYELPVAYDALTVVVSKDNTFVDQLTVDELKTMWEPAAQRKIMNWNQVRSTFPDLALKLAGAGADSGTFDYWTEAIMHRAKASRGDYQASEDDNVTVQFVSRDKSALGYFGMAYYEENADKLRAVPIVPPGGSEGVLPTAEAVNNGTYQPLSRPLFIYVKEKSLQREEVRQFVEFFLTEGAALAREVGYVELPEAAYELARENLKSGKLGSGFAGVPEIGLKVEDLLARERKM
jgi:phosphate transport system substrate-binding protein